MAAEVTAAVVAAAVFTAVVEASAVAVSTVEDLVEASMAVDTAASMVANVPTGGFAAVRGKATEVVADTEEWAENQRRHAITAQPGVRRLWLAQIPRRDGTRFLHDPAAMAERLQVAKWELPTVNGTPLAAPTVRQGLRWRTPGSAAMASSTTAATSVAEPGVAKAGAAEDGVAEAGVVDGAIPVTDLAGDAGPAAGDLDLAGVLPGILFGRFTRILTGATWGGVTLTATILRPTIFILIPLRAGRGAWAQGV